MRRKYETVEAVVMSVCEAFEIDDWRKFQSKTQLRETTIAKFALVGIIAQEIGCCLSDVHYYFPVYQRRLSYSISSAGLIQATRKNPSVRLKLEKAKKLVSEYYLLNPHQYEV